MNNLNVILKFINKNNNFSDFNLIENYINTINFGEFRGGAINDKNVNDGIINDGIINDGIINGGIINGGIINDKIINDGSINTENDKYTINEGTILFHASNSKKFNQNKIKFGDTSLYAFFTNSLDIASSTTKLYNSKEKENFIHVFKTKKNIDNLVFDLVNDKSNTKINNSVNKNEYNGICFKYPCENRIERFKNNIKNNDNIKFHEITNNLSKNKKNDTLEIALFDPQHTLDYLYSFNCEKIN